MKRRDVVTTIAGVTLATALVGTTAKWHEDSQRADALEARIAELQKQEQRSAVIRSVSKQMEEIAFQQKEISDEQREEALQQTHKANEMRLRSEQERKKAIEAEMLALASERKALKAQSLAEQQQQIAEHQRIKAEMSKRTADTLSYIALGRSLGSLSTLQFQSGNSELATLLAYASYHYTRRYQGDLFQPAVLQSLTTASQARRNWSVHTGAIMGISFFKNNNNSLISVSNYGEIIRHFKKNNQLTSKMLFKNSNYDFRHVYINENNTIFAVSRTGHLVIIDANESTTIKQIDNMVHPLAIMALQKKTIAVVGEQSIAFFDSNSYAQTGTLNLKFKTTAACRGQEGIIVFDDHGNMIFVTSPKNCEYHQAPVKETITAYASSGHEGLRAFGTSEGNIYITNRNGQQLKKLIGHRSRISHLKYNGTRLFSSSYDGTLNLWNTSNEKIEPMLLSTSNGWTMYFTTDEKKDYVWTGDMNGNLTETLVSIPIMIKTIKGSLKRELTNEEWNYFIGPNIPKESFLKNEKGGR